MRRTIFRWNRIVFIFLMVFMFGCANAGMIQEADSSQNGTVKQESIDEELLETYSDSSKVESATESEQHTDTAQLVNNLSNEEIIALFKDFLKQREFMYKKICTHHVKLEGEELQEWWEGLQSDTYLGYNLDDYDGDGKSELLILKVIDNERLLFEMYEVINSEVTLSDSKQLDCDSPYGGIQLPHGRDLIGNLCGILSCFVQESNHKIFLQVTDGVHKLGEGTGVSIASLTYNDGKFTNYDAFRMEGSDPDGLIDEYNSRLLNMGVSNPDFQGIFCLTTPLTECMDGGVKEFLHVEQKTDNILDVGSFIETSTQTKFWDNNDELVEPEHTEDSFTEQAQEEAGISLTMEDFENGFSMKVEEFKQKYGEPDSEEDNNYVYENVKFNGVNGTLTCEATSYVWSVNWSPYEPNDDLYDELIYILSESYDLQRWYNDNDEVASVTAYGGDKMIRVNRKPEIEWQIAGSNC